ncbi:MAG: ABC transporter permease [Streptosporangiaceae bacterium]|jgi:ribose transport system permease protein
MDSAVDRQEPLAPGSGGSPPGEQQRGWQLPWAPVAEKWALPILFVVMMAIFAGTANGFWNGENIRVVIGTQAPLAILAVAAMMPLVVGQFDLSVAAIAGTAGITLVTTIARFHVPLGVGILIALVVSGLIGLFNGMLVSFMNLNAFIVTLGVSTVLQGVVQGYTGGSVLAGVNINALETSLSGNTGGIPKGVFWFAPVALVAWYLLEQTPYGRHLRSIGSNAGAARLLGIPTRGLTLSTFVMSGVLGGLAGVALVAQSGSADPSVTLGTDLLPALAAGFLGASAFLPGLFNVAGTVLAIFFVAFLVDGLQYLGAQPWTSPVIDGAVLVCAITVSSLLRRDRARQ